jgi:hypothetical protein
VQSAGLYYYGMLHINGGGYDNVDGLAGPIQLETTIDDSPTVYTLQAFCADLYHDINVALGSQYGKPLTYVTSLLTTDSSGAVSGTGNPLTSSQSDKMAGLAVLGNELYKSNASDLTNKEIAIQGAIWTIENPGVSISSYDADVQSLLTGYIANASHLQLTRPVYGIYDTVNEPQGLVNANLVTGVFSPTGAVPEPATWMMMILGIGGLGAVLRRRRALNPVAA